MESSSNDSCRHLVTQTTNADQNTTTELSSKSNQNTKMPENELEADNLISPRSGTNTHYSEFKSCDDLISNISNLEVDDNTICNESNNIEDFKTPMATLKTPKVKGVKGILANQNFNNNNNSNQGIITSQPNKNSTNKLPQTSSSSLNNSNLAQYGQTNLNKTQNSAHHNQGHITPSHLASSYSINYYEKLDFDKKLCKCCENKGLCFITTFCYCLPIGLSAVASKFFKDRCSATVSGLLCPCLMLCGIRENTRKKFNINGTVVEDCCCSFCCCYCTTCQLSRELGLYD